MPWKHVFSPAKGIITARPSTGIPAESSPYMGGTIIRDGEIWSDWGMASYPTPSTTSSNALIGSVMKISQFPITSGVTFEICITTRQIYSFNTVTMTWDCITRGTLICDCESTFTASSNVTSTSDTVIFLRGTKSSKNVIASAFTTGIVSYFNFSSLNISTSDHLTFWVYSTISISSDVLRLRVSEQNAGGTGGVYGDYTIPALVANTWTHVSVALNAPAAFGTGALNALLSVALVAHSDPGIATVYLDDIRSTIEFTGNLNNRFSVGVYQDTLLITNGKDNPSQVNSSLVHLTLTLSLNSGAVTTTQVILPFKDHILYMCNTENGANVPQRVTWTNIGTTTDLIDGTAGYQDLIDDPSFIIGAALLNEDQAIVYKENSIVCCTWIGGQNPFRFDTLDSTIGALSKDLIVNVEGIHVVFGPSFIYSFDGNPPVKPLDVNINKYVYNLLNLTCIQTNFAQYISSDREVQFWLTTTGTNPTDGWCFNIVDGTFYRKSRSITGSGELVSQIELTIGDLIGTIGQQNFTFGSTLIQANSLIETVGDVNGLVYQVSKLYSDNNGIAFTREYQTPDFVLPDQADYENNFMRVKQFVFEAYGGQVTVEYSNDGGASWNPCQGNSTNTVTLTSTYQYYQLFFEVTVKVIRFRFTDTTIGNNYRVRYYGFYWDLRTGRL